MLIRTVGADGRITIPQQVLDALTLAPGDAIGFFVEGGAVHLAPVAGRSGATGPAPLHADPALQALMAFVGGTPDHRAATE